MKKYKDVNKKFKNHNRSKFSIEDSEEEKTEDLIGTSMMNSDRKHSLDVEDLHYRWKWSNHASSAHRPDTEVSIQAGDKSSIGQSRYVSKQSSNQFDWGDHTKKNSEELHEKYRKTFNIEIPESDTFKTGEFLQEKDRITLKKMNRKKCMVKRPNNRRNNSKENLYCSSGVWCRKIILKKIRKKSQKMLEMVRSTENKNLLQDMFDEIEREMTLFIKHFQRVDFESVGINLYKQTSQKYNKGLQERLLEIKKKYHNLEREMTELHMKNEKMHKSQQKKPTPVEFDCTKTEEKAEANPFEITA